MLDGAGAVIDLDVEMHAIIVVAAALDILEADRGAGAVDHDGGVGFRGEAERCQAGDFGLVIGTDGIAIEQGYPEGSEPGGFVAVEYDLVDLAHGSSP
ncbi:hypothetical protein D3C72_2131510 [compost metagenome]